MAREIHLSRGNSPYVGRLAKGCRECMKGGKLVLFITGQCLKSCFYCPISEERRGRDIIFANEIEVNDPQQALTEAKMIDATGMGITGGEPLLEVERTSHLIQIFKQEFGSKFHVHLYTGLEPVPIDVVEKLLEVGLDELRLHRFQVGDDLPALQKTMRGRARLGIEIPVIPGMLAQLKIMFRQLDGMGIDFVNINELEFAALNAEEFHRQGLRLDSETIASVKGSEDEALRLLEWAATETRLNVHYCPLSLKDGTQLRNRFRRRAKNVVKPFERISKEGLLVKGVIIPPADLSLEAIREILTQEYQVSPAQLWINKKLTRIETSTRIARRLATRLRTRGIQVGIVEEYPIESRFQVSFSPI